eukprot:1645789-Rhodomonas_salina.1
MLSGSMGRGCSLISSAIKATDSDNTTVVAVLFKKLPQVSPDAHTKAADAVTHNNRHRRSSS